MRFFLLIALCLLALLALAADLVAATNQPSRSPTSSPTLTPVAGPEGVGISAFVLGLVSTAVILFV